MEEGQDVQGMSTQKVQQFAKGIIKTYSYLSEWMLCLVLLLVQLLGISQNFSGFSGWQQFSVQKGKK